MSWFIPIPTGENGENPITGTTDYVETGEAEGTPKSGFIVRRGAKTGFQREDRFSPVNSFAFNPFAQELMSIDNFFLMLMFLKLAKQPEGRKLISKLMDTYMKSSTSILNNIIDSGKAHPLTALNASTTFAVVAHRMGIITDSGYLKIVDQTRSIIDKLIILDFAGMAFDGLTSLVQTGTKGLGALADLKAVTP